MDAYGVLRLVGEVVKAEIGQSGDVCFVVDVGQPEMVRFGILLGRKDSTPGNGLLARLCTRHGIATLNEAEQLVGMGVAVDVMQPRVADGLVVPFVALAVYPI